MNRHLTKVVAVLLIGILAITLSAGVVKVNPHESAIVLPAQSGGVARFAAQELQYHLQLITGFKIPIVATAVKGQYLFRFDREVSKEKLRPEEGRWSVGAQETIFDGDDTVATGKNWLETVLSATSKNGTMSAVYDFLEKQFGVLWIEPGEVGIVYPEKKNLNLKSGNGTWAPGQLVMRQLRTDYAKYQYARLKKLVPKEFMPSREDYAKQTERTATWLKRQRMGVSKPINYGHAFTNWVARFGKTHPEYLALQADGRRGAEHVRAPADVKLCVSNPKVWEQIVADWSKRKSATLNICENDAGGYCRCANCCALDVPKAGEERFAHLTDRYVYFVNAVQAKAEAIRPDVVTVFYAYSYYCQPPRKIKSNPKTIFGFVPCMMSLDQAEEMYKGWYQMGARRLFLRPNDHHLNTGLPMGFEKQMFEAFKTGLKYGIVGTDYDTLHGFWNVTGVADYVLARGHVYPERTFEQHFAEYCSAFGAAAPEVAQFFEYWRKEVWEKRLMPNRQKLAERGRYGNYRRGLMWDLKYYYKESDFDKTDLMLNKGLAKKSLSAAERKRLEILKLANLHSRLLFRTVAATPAAKLNAAAKLHKFRMENKQKLNINWLTLTNVEGRFGDVAGTKLATMFAGYEAISMLNTTWRFALDDKDVGLKEKWNELSRDYVMSVWEPILVTAGWEVQPRTPMNENLKTRLKNYDGVGWYAQSFSVPPTWKGSEIYLHFGAVDESAWVWVNGKKAGERVYKEPDDWKNPFAIRIDQQIDWSKPNQVVTVRVFDKNGQGGIWKSVRLLKGKMVK